MQRSDVILVDVTSSPEFSRSSRIGFGGQDVDEKLVIIGKAPSHLKLGAAVHAIKSAKELAIEKHFTSAIDPSEY